MNDCSSGIGLPVSVGWAEPGRQGEVEAAASRGEAGCGVQDPADGSVNIILSLPLSSTRQAPSARTRPPQRTPP